MANDRILVVGPTGRGGVADVLRLIVPLLPDARWVPIGGLRAAVRADRILAGVGPGDVVHLHPSFRSRALLRDVALGRRAAARGARVILQFHGTSAAAVDVARLLPLRRWLAPLVVASVDPVLVEALRGMGIPATRLPNPVDPAALPEAREPEPGLVVSCGRLVPGKGLRALVRSVEGWPSGARLQVLGDGPLRAELAAAAGDRIAFSGWVDAAGRREAWRRAALLAHPSSSEGAPLVVLEALAAGVPVLGTRVGAVPESIGAAGALVDRAEPVALARAVTALLARPPDTTEARARIRAACDPETVAAAWRALYVDPVGRNTKPAASQSSRARR